MEEMRCMEISLKFSVQKLRGIQKSVNRKMDYCTNFMAGLRLRPVLRGLRWVPHPLLWV